MKKPAKTREQLEAEIRLEMEDISDWPTDLAVSVVPHEDSWKVEIMRHGPQRDTGRFDMIEAIADRLRSQFDLKPWAQLDGLNLSRRHAAGKPQRCGLA